jgi:predicted O-linked N-acetylglucosamine transferase (SPINDLY family)
LRDDEERRLAAGRVFTEAATAAERGSLPEAEQLYRRVLAMVPDHAVSWHALGLIRAATGDIQGAIGCCRQAVQHQADLVAARCDLGILMQSVQDPAAIACFSEVLALVPGHLQALLGMGNALEAAGREAEAVACLRRAVEADPAFAPALVNLGRLLLAQGEAADALVCYQRVLALRPAAAEGYYAVGTVLKALGRIAEAIGYLREAVRLDPGHLRALINLGNALKEDGQFDAAAACYEQVLALRPDAMDALNNLGHVRHEQGRVDEAAALHGRVLDVDPGNAHALVARCVAQLAIIHRDEAEIGRRRQAYADRLHALVAYGQQAGLAALASGIGADQPFYLPYQGQDDRALQAVYGDLVCSVMAARYPKAALALPVAGERIRVGFVSGFFCDHSNWKIPIKGWLSGLDRERFELFGYYTGKRQDDETAAARGLCHRFVQGPLTLDRWHDIILADRLHVLVYPEVGIDPMAVQLAAQRLAAVQCNSWGQPETSGFPTLDYFLSSDLMEPPEAEALYTEQLVRLPGLSICYDEAREVQPRAAARARFGLPSDSVVFWCGQSLYKFLPRHDDVFPRIALQAGDCRFLFIGFRHGRHVNDVFQARLTAAFAAHGLRAEDYCVMLPFMGRSDFVATYAASDIFLDSIGWSGCNTTLESLSHDLPIVTMAGAFMRGRHGAGILRQLGVADLVCGNVEEYCALAVRLACDRAWRETVGRRINAGKRLLYRDLAPVVALGDFLEAAARRVTVRHGALAPS